MALHLTHSHLSLAFLAVLSFCSGHQAHISKLPAFGQKKQEKDLA